MQKLLDASICAKPAAKKAKSKDDREAQKLYKNQTNDSCSDFLIRRDHHGMTNAEFHLCYICDEDEKITCPKYLDKYANYKGFVYHCKLCESFSPLWTALENSKNLALQGS